MRHLIGLPLKVLFDLVRPNSKSVSLQDVISRPQTGFMSNFQHSFQNCY